MKRQITGKFVHLDPATYLATIEIEDEGTIKPLADGEIKPVVYVQKINEIVDRLNLMAGNEPKVTQ